MLTLDYTFTSCKTQATNDDEIVGPATPKAHIATYTSIGTGGTTPKNRILPAEETNKTTIPPVDWEFIKLILESLKISMDVKPERVAHQLFGILATQTVI